MVLLKKSRFDQVDKFYHKLMINWNKTSQFLRSPCLLVNEWLYKLCQISYKKALRKI